MKSILYITIFLSLIEISYSQRLDYGNQSNSEYEEYDENKLTPHYIGPIETEYEEHFNIAVDEISKMINGEIPVSFKRGVFLIENAFYKGELNWELYCSKIDEIVNKIKPLVKENLQNGEDLAKNYSIFRFFHDSIPENNYQPFSYDFDTFLNNYDHSSHMTSNLIDSKLGNCMSLPFLYKIIANEMNAEAYLSTAPMHIFIKIKDNQGNWFNHEVTAGSFSRTSFIIESFGITDRAIQSGLYLKPLDEMESLGLLLEQLIYFYEKRTGKYYGDIVVKAVTEGLKVRPVSMLLGCVLSEIEFRIFYYLHINELPQDNKDVVMSIPYLKELSIQADELKQKIADIGYKKFSNKRYTELFEEVLKNKEKLIGASND